MLSAVRSAVSKLRALPLTASRIAPVSARVAVAHALLDLQRRVVARKDARGDVDAGNDDRLARVHDKRAHGIGVDHGLRRQIAIANVFESAKGRSADQQQSGRTYLSPVG